ncbi:MAG: aromatic ring-hydroxylating dioxygenase subunit alpha [Flavipsychrobacter sp.]|jgi:hypothetical protein|nr:aromatic ring-hydroxylating dioxygenase subunit alpha [Flavipsychrobacter sp.]
MASFHIDKDIAKAHTLATDYYTSPTHYEASKEKIFAPSWQFIGHASQVAENGTAYLSHCWSNTLMNRWCLHGIKMARYTA